MNQLNIGPDPNAPQTTVQNLYQLVDNVSWVKGKHNLRFGGEFRWIISPQTFTQRVRGDYEWGFTSDYLNDFASFPTTGGFSERSAGNTTSTTATRRRITPTPMTSGAFRRPSP